MRITQFIKRWRNNLELFWKNEYLTLKEVEIPKLITEFLKTFDRIEENLTTELKDATWNEDIINKTKDAEYWKGFRYGIQSFWGDWIQPEKEKWEEKKKVNRKECL